MKLTVNDFFCGCGGMGLAFKQAGFEIVGAWDFDKFAVQSYASNVGEHVKQIDIAKMTWRDIPKADVWTYGFPCNDLSVSGKQAGLIEGTKSRLFFEVMRLLDEIKENCPENLPRTLLAENVRGLRKYLPVLSDEHKTRGYGMYVELYNSKYWGVPQSRERYYVVGVRNDIDLGRFNFPIQYQGNVLPLSSIQEPVVDEKYFMPEGKAQSIIEEALKCTRVVELVEEPRIKVMGLLDITAHDHNRRVHDPSGLSPTVTAVSGGTHHIKVFDYTKYRVRKLTPREYARLQGFPESYSIVVSDTQAYKQLGNAVTVTLVKNIANSIKCFLGVVE